MTRLLPDLFDALLFDLDGVIYVGPTAVQGAVAGVAAAQAQGLTTSFVTNNASRTPFEVASHLRGLGIRLKDSDVVTSSEAGTRLIAGFVAPGSRILAIGGPGVRAALLAGGFQPVHSLEDDPCAVLQGIGMELAWRDLAEATFAVAAGLPWVATNMDSTFPTARGLAPGNGSMVAAVSHATGRVPNAVGGKPEPALLAEAIDRAGARRPLMIGDRLDTDIAAGSRLGIPTLLILTGVTDRSILSAARGDEIPTYVADDLTCLNPGASWDDLRWTGEYREE